MLLVFAKLGCVKRIHYVFRPNMMSRFEKATYILSNLLLPGTTGAGV